MIRNDAFESPPKLQTKSDTRQGFGKTEQQTRTKQLDEVQVFKCKHTLAFTKLWNGITPAL